MSYTDFEMAFGDTPNRFEESVRSFLDEGFRLHGHPFIGRNHNEEEIFCQAMVKRVERCGECGDEIKRRVPPATPMCRDCSSKLSKSLDVTEEFLGPRPASRKATTIEDHKNGF